MSTKELLLIAALICELLAAFQAYFNPAPRINFMCLGFAFIIASVLF